MVIKVTRRLINTDVISSSSIIAKSGYSWKNAETKKVHANIGAWVINEYFFVNVRQQKMKM